MPLLVEEPDLPHLLYEELLEPAEEVEVVRRDANRSWCPEPWLPLEGAHNVVENRHRILVVRSWIRFRYEPRVIGREVVVVLAGSDEEVRPDVCQPVRVLEDNEYGAVIW